MIRPIAITPGEPAGVGPDLVLQLLAADQLPTPYQIIANKQMLAERAELLGLTVNLDHVIDLPVAHPVVPGKLDPANVDYVLNTIKLAAEGCLKKIFSAMVTGPVQKSIITAAGYTFSGHTEYLAKLSNVHKTVMTMMAPSLRIALLTTHIPLQDVCHYITAENLILTAQIIHHDMQKYCGINHPRIIVCGVNPHAGEQGTLGMEEQTILLPALQKLQQQNINIIGPVAADTAFTEQYRQPNDIILTMYHDQGLPVIKAEYFYDTVNVTFGLPFLRVSVDHGTALALAGTGNAATQSLYQALQFAKQHANQLHLGHA